MPRSKSVADHSLLEAALQGLELQRQRLEDQIREVRSRLGQRGGRTAATKQEPAAKKGRRPRRKLSDQARKRIAAAQKKRWAAFRKKTAAGSSSS